jgi:hypothetical protein
MVAITQVTAPKILKASPTLSISIFCDKSHKHKRTSHQHKMPNQKLHIIIKNTFKNIEVVS